MSHREERPPDGRSASTDPQAPTAPVRASTPRRIDVAVTPAMLEAIDRVVADQNVTVTEAVRRLITYGDLVYPLVQAQHGGGSSCVA